MDPNRRCKGCPKATEKYNCFMWHLKNCRIQFVLGKKKKKTSNRQIRNTQVHGKKSGQKFEDLMVMNLSFLLKEIELNWKKNSVRDNHDQICCLSYKGPVSVCWCVWWGVSQQLKSTYKGGRVPWERARRTENELLNVAVAFLGKFCLVIASPFIVMVTANTYRNSIIRNCSHPCLTMKTLCLWICQPRSTKAKQALFSYRTCSLRYCLVLCSNVSPLIPGDANQSTWPR